MIKNILILITLFITTISFAQSPPQAINYQAVARDATGDPMVNSSLTVIFEVLQGSSSGGAVYSETQTLTTNQFGLFTAAIGAGTPNSPFTTASFASINWGLSLYYLQVTADGDVMPATQLLSVPYALHAGTVTLGDNWGADTVVSNASLTGNGTMLAPLEVANPLPTAGNISGNILVWDGSSWVAGVDSINDADHDSINELITTFDVNSGNLRIVEAGDTSMVPLVSFHDGNGIYSNSDSLNGNTVITGGTSTLSLTSTVTNAFSVDSNTFSVDANSNRVGIGTNTPEELLHLKSSDSDLDIETNHGTQSSSIHFKQSGGTSLAPTPISSSQYFGNISFMGYDGSNYQYGARIEGSVDGTPSSSSMPGKLVFHTRSDTSSSPQERMRITSDGNVGIGTTSPPAAKLHVNGVQAFVPSIQDVTPSGYQIDPNISSYVELTASGSVNLSTTAPILDGLTFGQILYVTNLSAYAVNMPTPFTFYINANQSAIFVWSTLGWRVLSKP